jgi:hypothetical protein
VVLSLAEEPTMNELLTLNVFAQSLPFAVSGVALFAGLIALPWWPRRRAHDAPATHDGGCASTSPCVLPHPLQESPSPCA